ncbi:hypothetical protein BHU11_05470 [Tannerella sp. oral taxon 808]|nr:hypothetical protein BHU11_05470 [Tannerella sp. oral taxon 808]
MTKIVLFAVILRMERVIQLCDIHLDESDYARNIQFDLFHKAVLYYMFNSFIRNTLQSYNHLSHLKAQGAELSNFFLRNCLRLLDVFDLKHPFASGFCVFSI